MAFEAMYPGRCAGDCGKPIEVGDLIQRTDEGGDYVHHGCATREKPSRLDLQPGEVVCTDCFMIKPCPCQDGV